MTDKLDPGGSWPHAADASCPPARAVPSHAVLLGRSEADAGGSIGFSARRPAAAGGKILFDDTEAHAAVIAPTGAGKGVNVIIPNLLHYDGPAIVVDIKGEAAEVTARHRRALGQEVIVLDPFGCTSFESATLNPLDLLRMPGASHDDDCLMLATMLGEGKRGTKEPFWDDLGTDLLCGLIGLAATKEKVEERTLGAVWEVFAKDDFIYNLAVILDTIGPSLPKSTYSQIANFLQHEGEKVRSSVRSVVQQYLRVFSSATMQHAVSRTSFDLGGVLRGDPMTIYLVFPPDKLESHAALLRLWLTSLTTVIIQREARPEKPTLLVVDELAQLGALPHVKQAITLLRGYGLRCAIFLQSLAQLRNLWPLDYETILDNCGAFLTFGHTQYSTSRQIAEILGDVSAEQLFRMRGDQLAVRQAGRSTAVAQRLNYLTDAMFAGTFDENPRRPRAPIGFSDPEAA